MKLSVVLVILGTFQVTANTFAQKLTIKKEHAHLTEVFKEIRKQTGYDFIYSDKLIQTAKEVDIDVVDGELSHVLQHIFANQPLDYAIQGTTINLKERTIRKEVHTPQVQQKILLSGRVTDPTGAPLPGATVLAIGDQVYAVSDANGDFSIPVSSPSDSLRFTSVGFKALVVPVGDRRTFQIQLELQETQMEDVVVTGIFTRSKDSFTGSTATFSGEELKNIGVQNVIQSLKTLDPSFNVMDSREFGSDPNRLPDIEIRGKTSIIGLEEEYAMNPNQPLFILDGFETDLQTIVNLNMNRVGSITLLKDAASTALYGSKAANGVVVVETVKPGIGKFKISYSGNMLLTMPDLSDYNLMNAAEKLEFELKAGRYNGNNAQEQLFFDSLYNLNQAEIARGVDTYWLSEPLRTAGTFKHHLYADGGNEVIRYGIGFDYTDSKGVMKQSSNNLAGAHFDLTYRNGRLLVSNKLSYDYYQQENPIVSFSQFARTNPYYRKDIGTDEDGRYLANIKTYNGFYRVENPIYNATLNSFNKGNRASFNNKLNAEFRILSSLILRGRFGLGHMHSKTDNFTSPKNPMYDHTSFDRKGSYTSSIGGQFIYDGDVTLSFGKILKENHQVNVILGSRLRSDQNTSETNRSIGFPIGDFIRPSFSSGYAEGSKPSYSRIITRSNSVYLNGGYAFRNTYLLDANIRFDGASVFGSNKRYSETWALGLGWNLHNEAFLKDANWVSHLKLRGSIGNPGNQNFSSFQSFTTYAFNNWIQNPFGASMTVANFGNPDLAWQKTLDKNVGFDVILAGNRISMVFDYYNKVTDPLLARISVPSSVGTKTILTNLGEQFNEGVSGTIRYSPIYRPAERINWTVSVNFRHQVAKYRNIGNSLDMFNEDNKNKNLTRYYDGGSPNSLWSVPSLGINPTDGRELFLKKDGSYTFMYNTDDEIIVGNSEPTLEGVIGNTLFHKNFSLSLYFRYSLGADVFMRALYSKVENISQGQLPYNQDRRALHDRWQQPGDLSLYKGISLTETTPISSRFVQQENYIKAESMAIGYNFESNAIKRLGMQSLRLQAHANDLFRLSSIKEERGIEYPFARSYSLSLSAMF